MFPNLKTSLAPLVLRLGLASIFLIHGYIKILHDGGTNWQPNRLSHTVQFLVAWGEMLCGLAMALGLLSRLAAVGIAVIMIGAIITVTGHHEFVGTQHFGRDINYGAAQVGYEYNFAIIVMCFALIVLGSGTWSLDGCLVRWWKRPAVAAAAERGLPVASVPS